MVSQSKNCLLVEIFLAMKLKLRGFANLFNWLYFIPILKEYSFWIFIDGK